jgi:hypothetical protein
MTESVHTVAPLARIAHGEMSATARFSNALVRRLPLRRAAVPVLSTASATTAGDHL